MKSQLTIIAAFLCQMAFSQREEDSIYFKNFDIFISRTETLIRNVHQFGDTTIRKKQKHSKKDSTNFYADEVKKALRKLDSMRNFFGMAGYFQRGNKPGRSQDLSSPVCQLQCSYSHYMQNLRYVKDSIPAIVKAALILETHLRKGYPESIYCPYIYDEVQFGPGLAPPKPPTKKIVLPDTMRKEN